MKSNVELTLPFVSTVTGTATVERRGLGNKSTYVPFVSAKQAKTLTYVI
jgi:hypothetical protein